LTEAIEHKLAVKERCKDMQKVLPTNGPYSARVSSASPIEIVLYSRY
jgi:hypothetical protein